jgi:glycogen(starch) synthase
MRIAIVTPEYPVARPAFGGIAAQYAAMAPSLAALGDDVHVFVVAAQRGPSEQRSGVTVHPVVIRRGTGPLFAIARNIVTHRTFGESGAFDMVLVADWLGNGALLGASKGPPMITHLHTSLALLLRISKLGIGDRVTGNFRSRLQLYLERRQAERSQALLACSQAILDASREFWDVDDKPSHVLPNIIDPERIRSLAYNGGDYPSSHDAPVIVVPGRLETRKGVGVLVCAMHGVWDMHPDAKLVLAGTDGLLDGRPARKQITHLAGNRSRNVEFAGALIPERLFPLLASADVVATPSLWEAFGLATLEAMALGKRVVATSGSGYSEFCRDEINCFLAKPDDVESLTGCLLRALSEDQSGLGLAASHTADEFSVARRAPAYQMYFHSIAAA